MSASTKRGFTLLELLVVIAIIAALSTAFPVALNRLVPARRLDAAARTLVADIHLAQLRSVASGKPVSLEFDKHGYQFNSGEMHRLRPSTTIELRANDDALPAAALSVFPDGSTTGGRFEIRDGARARVITVSPLTGRVTLESAT